MTRVDGLPNPEAKAAIEQAHPGWHIWADRAGNVWATSIQLGPPGGGVTVDAPSIEQIERPIAEAERAGRAA